VIWLAVIGGTVRSLEVSVGRGVVPGSDCDVRAGRLFKSRLESGLSPAFLVVTSTAEDTCLRCAQRYHFPSITVE